MALCSQDDVEMRLQIDFGADPDPVCAELIAAAQSRYEREAGRLLEVPASPYVEVYNPPRGSVLWLTHYPVATITEVDEDGVTLVEGTDFYIGAESGRVERIKNGYPALWTPTKVQTITVTYDAGYDTTHRLWNAINDDVAWMVAAAFMRGASAASESGFLDGVESETIGTHTLRYMALVRDSSQWIGMTVEQKDNARLLRRPGPWGLA